jgi:hypothetical protein
MVRLEVEVRGGTRQGQQLAQQRDIVVIPRARHEQRPDFAELGFDRVVADEPGGLGRWTFCSPATFEGLQSERAPDPVR